MTTPAELALEDVEATRALARRIAAALRAGDVVTLSGPLGSGKSELARALIQARAGAAIEVPSPSFTLVQDYEVGALTIRHIDLYRIEQPGELEELGLIAPAADEAWLIEWPERAPALLPEGRLEITLLQGPRPEARIARLVAGPGWTSRLPGLRSDP